MSAPDSHHGSHAAPKGPAELGGLNPDELFARAMQSVKMTAAGGLTSWEPPTDEEAARLFPNYEILGIIGRGGMGAVYKARQLALDRTVAIKLLPLEVSVDRDFAERFKREAKLMARMNHPAIVSVYDFGTTPEGHLFFVMEFVEGTTLHHLIKTTGLKPTHALEVIVGVCEALHYAHAEGVVHRDIKPANVLVDVRGRVKVTDFGLARNNVSAAEQAGYTMTGTVLGTPDYMAPEQKRGMHVDHRADIYSLGVMLYEMLCGNVPQGIFDPPSHKVGVDERVDQIVIRAMQQEPERRYQNTAEMKHEVQTIRSSHDPNAKAPRPRTATSTSPAKKGHGVLVGGIIAGAVVIAAAIFFSRPKEPEKKEPEKNVAVAPTPEPAKPTPEPAKPAPEPVKIAVTEPPKPAPGPVVDPDKPALVIAPPAVPAVSRPDPAVRPAANPAMAEAVAQISPNATPPLPPGTVPAPALEAWRRQAELADVLAKKRDPEGAIAALTKAIELAENSATPVPPVDHARLYLRMGALEAAIGGTAEARGTFEEGKRIIRAAKAGPEGAQVLAELEISQRKLPREE